MVLFYSLSNSHIIYSTTRVYACVLWPRESDPNTTRGGSVMICSFLFLKGVGLGLGIISNLWFWCMYSPVMFPIPSYCSSTPHKARLPRRQWDVSWLSDFARWHSENGLASQLLKFEWLIWGATCHAWYVGVHFGVRSKFESVFMDLWGKCRYTTVCGHCYTTFQPWWVH